MTLPFKIVAVMPAHNEEKTVGAMVAEVKKYVSEVIVVDDNSSDTTGEVARGAGAIVLHNDISRGYDQSIDRGFREAAGLGADIVLTCDADGEHDPADVPRILAPILEGKADIVLGQRPKGRHFGEKIFALYTRLRYNIPDPLCGLKAYRREVYDRVGHFDTIGSIGTQLMLEGVRRNFRLALVPITLRARGADTSRFYADNIRANMKIFKALWKVLFI